MPRLGNLEFDDRILDALKDDNLIVFAGDGVSMGLPSNLDSFWRLAEKIARGTGLPPVEPLDRFLGVLQHRGVAVRDRAVELLSPEGSAPTDLHRNLIRLFGAADRVKLVTTNFDLHFETAAREAFGTSPEVYRAPALPLGYDFNGIVHVHGALPHAPSVVLTDSDFGRAYLDERNQLLAFWLAKHYAIEHFGECFEPIAGHGLQLNPILWSAVGRELGLEKDKPIDESALRRWVLLLLASVPENAD